MALFKSWIMSEIGSLLLLFEDSNCGKKLKHIYFTGDYVCSQNLLDKCPDVDWRSDKILFSIVAPLLDFLNGIPTKLSLKSLVLNHLPNFQKSVLLAEAQIPWGNVSTYRNIAQFLDSPNAQRAVGNALAKNPFPFFIPCHRTIRGDYHIGGFRGGVEMKKVLLKREGLTISPNGTIKNAKSFFYTFTHGDMA